MRPSPLVAGVPTLSDLLLHTLDRTPSARDAAAPADVEEAAVRALTGSRVRRGDPVGIAWEMYNLPLREAISLEVTIAPAERGRMRRFGEWLGVVDAPAPVVIAWTESGPEAMAAVFRSVALDLEGFDEGDYVLRLEVRLAGSTAVSAARPLSIVPPDS